MLYHKKFAAADAHRFPLPVVICKALPRWAELPKIHHQRTQDLTMCRSCPGREHCAGGCTGRTYAVHGEMMAPEDRCALRKAVYYWKTF
jgi:sulfatase maturation enzyme AslB (radical SAM superfamily)